MPLPSATVSTVRVLAEQAVERQQAYQRPEELAALCEILVARLPVRPRILEIGLGAGGSAWMWRALWPSALIVGVDHKDAPCEGCARRRAHSGCPRARIAATLDKALRGDSVRDRDRLSAELAELSWKALEEDVADFDFVHIDGDHSYPAVRSDFRTYGRLGRIVALHDTLAYPGVREFLAELRGQSPPGELVEIGEEPSGYGYAVLLRC